MTPQKDILFVVENETVPFDSRVMWQARTLADAGHSVRVIAPMRPGLSRREVIDGVEVRRVRYPDGPRIGGHLLEYFLGMLQLGKAVELAHRRRRVDVLVTASPPDLLTLVGAIRQRRGSRLVFDHHDLSPELWLAQGGNATGRTHRLLLWAERRAAMQADHVMTVNETYRNLLVNRTGLDDSDVSIVMNGVDHERFVVANDGPRHTWPWKTTVGYVGSMGPQDGVDAAVRALRVAVDAGRDVGLALAGDGPTLREVQKLTASLSLDGRVEFLGRITHEEVPGFLASVDIGISPDPPNPFNDASTMIKTIEYLAAGLPIVSNDLQETRRLCGSAAVYSSSPDELGLALADLAGDAELRERCSLAARDRAQSFSRDQWISPLISAVVGHHCSS